MKDGELVSLIPPDADETIGTSPLELKLPKAGIWIARPKRTYWGFATAIAGPIAFQLPNIIRTVFKDLYGIAAGWLAFVLTLALIMGLAIWLVRRRQRMGAFDKALLDGSFGDQFPAEIVISTGGKQLGSDRGVIWFDDGLMGFSGSAASFVLAASDLAPIQSGKKKKVAGQRNLPAGALGLRGAPDRSYVLVMPLGRHTQKYTERFRQFIEADARPEGERFLPPLEPYSPGPSALE